MTKYIKYGECNLCGLCCLVEMTGHKIKNGEKDWLEMLRDGWKVARSTKTMLYLARWSPCPYLGFDMKCQHHGKREQPPVCRDFPTEPEGFYQLIKDKCSIRFKKIRR